MDHMSTDAPPLTEFLLARIAEDEQTARDAGADAMAGARWKAYPEAAYNELQQASLDRSRRVLAECEAKRRIVELGGEAETLDDQTWFDRGLPSDPGYNDPRCGERILRVLAAVYADHSDYHEEWRA